MSSGNVKLREQMETHVLPVEAKVENTQSLVIQPDIVSCCSMLVNDYTHDPPKMLVKIAAFAPVAFIAARQGIETELSHGNMYPGMIWYIDMKPKAYQNHLNLFDVFRSDQCRFWRSDNSGIWDQ